MSNVNFMTENGEFRAVDFVTEESWEKAREQIEGAGVDFEEFVPTVQGLRRLAMQTPNRDPSLGVQNLWIRHCEDLGSQVADTKNVLRNETDYGFVRLDVAVPSPQYEPPTSSALEGDAGTRITSSDAANEFTHLRGARLNGALSIRSLPLSELGVVLQYREQI